MGWVLGRGLVWFGVGGLEGCWRWGEDCEGLLGWECGA